MHALVSAAAPHPGHAAPGPVAHAMAALIIAAVILAALWVVGRAVFPRRRKTAARPPSPYAAPARRR